MRSRLAAVLMAVTFALVACDGETVIDGIDQTSAGLSVESAVLSRCNQMMSFSELHFTMTVTNTGTHTLVLGDIAFDGSDAVATYAAGETTLSAPVMLPPGQSVRFSCAPDVPLAWYGGEEQVELHVDMALSREDGSSAGLAGGGGTLQFVEAWDSCDTFAGEPHPCQPIPVD